MHCIRNFQKGSGWKSEKKNSVPEIKHKLKNYCLINLHLDHDSVLNYVQPVRPPNILLHLQYFQMAIKVTIWFYFHKYHETKKKYKSYHPNKMNTKDL